MWQSWKGFAAGCSHGKNVYKLLSQGQVAVTGPADQVVIEAARTASKTNGMQNTARLTDDNSLSTPISAGALADATPVEQMVSMIKIA